MVRVDRDRGLPEEPPLAAGGRVGEWITGSFAAVAALAAVRDARRSGRGAHIDVAKLDCMAVTMVSYPTVHSAMAGWPDETGPARVVEIPSVEPTADGYVVVTTNSAQQYDDFMVQIGRADVLENKPELAQRAPRWVRRDEYEAMVHEYSTARSTEQVLEDAELLRVPVRTGTQRRDPPQGRPLRRARRVRAVAVGAVRATSNPVPDQWRRAASVRTGAGRSANTRAPSRGSRELPARPATRPAVPSKVCEWSTAPPGGRAPRRRTCSRRSAPT